MSAQLAHTNNPEGEEAPKLVDSDLVRADVLKGFKEMQAIDKKREDLNAKSNEIRARLRNRGVPTKAFNAAYARYNMDADKREAHDFAFALCCNAGGVGYQPSLFEVQEAQATAEVDGTE